MWWSGRSRRRVTSGRATVAGTQARKAWAEIAYPPALDAGNAAPVSDSITTAPLPAVVRPRTGVRLGFADGTSVELDAADPQSVALRAAANDLTSLESRQR